MNKTQDQFHEINETLMNPLNSSKSKYQYSFTKAERFNTESSKLSGSSSTYRYYHIPSTNNKKAIKFGTSRRCTFQTETGIPPATKYTPINIDEFEALAKNQNLKKKKGFSFATGRDKAISNSFIKLNSNPGPGNYDPNPEFTTQANKSFSGFSMTKEARFGNGSGSGDRRNTETIENAINDGGPNKKSDQKWDVKRHSKSQLSMGRPHDDIPGPAQYEIKSTLGCGNKILSQDKNNNPCPRMISAKTESRRRLSTQPQSGSGKIYNPQMTSKGFYVGFEGGNGQSNKMRGYSIGRGKRADFVKNKDIPGPGNYRLFSEFINPRKSGGVS